MTRRSQIDRDVFQHQLVGIAEEMSAALRRAAFSPIIWDMYDYSCALFSGNGEMIAQAETIPAQLGVMSTALRSVVREIPLDGWQPGDVIICNDPYRGCTHTPDMVLFSPVFHEDRIIGFTSTIAHHVDIGGRLPSTTAPDNIEVFAEGLIFPPLKIVDGGEMNQTVLRMIGANVRNPRACIGDLYAQIAGCRTGEQRLKALARRYGTVRFEELTAECLDYGERYVRRSLALLPPGSRRAKIAIEDDIASTEPMSIAVCVTIAGDELTIDFTGTTAQRHNALNCPLASTISMSLYAVRCVVAPDIAQNDGCARPVKVIVPQGSLLNPVRPAAVGIRHYTQQAVADAVLKALVDVAPDRSAAGCHISFPSFRAGGSDDRPEAQARQSRPYFIVHDIIGGGMGAHRNGDGRNAVDTHGGNCALLSAEITEMVSPIRVLRSELVPGSGGAGMNRGGLAMRREYEILAERAIVSVYRQQCDELTAPWPVAGGGSGRPAQAMLNPGKHGERALASKAIGLALTRGDVVRLESAGGGGWGDPATRAAADVARDAHEGYV
jgi:N-methylhydantoinase B